jgi:hypothetical protein
LASSQELQPAGKNPDGLFRFPNRTAARVKLLVWDKMLGLGTTDPLAGFASTTANLIVSFHFAKRGFENVAKIIRR